MRKKTAKLDLSYLKQGPLFNEAANVYVAERKAMLNAAKRGNLLLIKQLLQEHKLTDFEETWITSIAEEPDEHCTSAQILCNAVRAGQMEVISYLVNIVGADLNATDDDDDSTPIEHAAVMGRNDILNFLIVEREGISEETLESALSGAMYNKQETTTTTLIYKLNKSIDYVEGCVEYYRKNPPYKVDLARVEMLSRIAAKMKTQQQQAMSVTTFLALTASMDTIQRSQTTLAITALAAMISGTTTVTLDSTHSSQSNGSSSSTSAPSQAGSSLSAFASFTTTDHKRKKSKRKLIAGDTTSDPMAKKTSSSALFTMPKAPDEKINVLLSKVYATLDQAYPESMVEHMHERIAYLLQLTNYSTNKVLASLDEARLTKILTTLKSVISQRMTSGKTMT